jgi:predicted DNA-binding ribbon-helix-helix protein
MSRSRLVNRNVVGVNGRTSMRLEPELWDALQEICRRERIDVGAMVRRIEAIGRVKAGGLECIDPESPGGRTSRVRVFILQYFRMIADDKMENCLRSRTDVCTCSYLDEPSEPPT